MVGFLKEAELPFAIALTKADKLSKQKANTQKQRLAKALDLPKGCPVILTSAEAGTGIEDLRRLIAERAE